MEERRRAKRYTVSFPVALESHGGGRYVFSTRVRNVAARGLLVMMAAELEVGEPVEITYTVEGRDIVYHDLEGKIVRVEPNDGDGKEEWPYLAAVEFSGALPHLKDLLGYEPELADSRDGIETSDDDDGPSPRPEKTIRPSMWIGSVK
jgi:hypothetical protein